MRKRVASLVSASAVCGVSDTSLRRAQIAALKSDVVQLSRRRDQLLPDNARRPADAGTATCVELVLAQQGAGDHAYAVLLDMLLTKVAEYAGDVLRTLRGDLDGGPPTPTRTGSYLPNIVALVEYVQTRGEATNILRRQLAEMTAHCDNLEKNTVCVVPTKDTATQVGAEITITSRANGCEECAAARRANVELRAEVARLAHTAHAAKHETISTNEYEREMTRCEDQIRVLHSKLDDKTGIIRAQQTQIGELMDRLLVTASLEHGLADGDTAAFRMREDIRRRSSSLAEGRELMELTKTAVDAIVAAKDIEIASLKRAVVTADRLRLAMAGRQDAYLEERLLLAARIQELERKCT